MRRAQQTEKGSRRVHCMAMACEQLAICASRCTRHCTAARCGPLCCHASRGARRLRPPLLLQQRLHIQQLRCGVPAPLQLLRVWCMGRGSRLGVVGRWARSTTTNTQTSGGQTMCSATHGMPPTALTLSLPHLPAAPAAAVAAACHRCCPPRFDNPQPHPPAALLWPAAVWLQAPSPRCARCAPVLLG